MTGPPDRTDILVVGAGPAGSAAAATLARAGRQVILVDKATFPRDKCCGDGLTAAALRDLEDLGLDPRSLPSAMPVGDVSIRSPSGRVARLPLGRDGRLLGLCCRRIELDDALRQLAGSAGADIREGCAFEGFEALGGHVVVRSTGGRIAARMVVACDGAWSPVRKATAGVAAGGKDLGEWHAFRHYYAGVSPEASRHLWIWFDERTLPGYAWSFPLGDGRANVGVMLARRGGVTGAAMQRSFEETLRAPWTTSLLGRGARPDGPGRSWPIPATPGAPLVAAGGAVLFAGDAARLADPLTGEGVAQALQSGVAAAEAALSYDDPRQAGEAYERVVRRTLGVDNRFAAFLARLLEPPLGGAAARGAVRIAATPAISGQVGRWLFEDYPRGILATPRRWRRGVLRPTGPFEGRSADPPT